MHGKQMQSCRQAELHISWKKIGVITLRPILQLTICKTLSAYLNSYKDLSMLKCQCSCQTLQCAKQKTPHFFATFQPKIKAAVVSSYPLYPLQFRFNMGVCNLAVLIFVFAPIPLWIVILSSYNYYYDYVVTTVDPIDTTQVFDYIVVGGGSAGAVVANRLSRNNKVLLLEAGGDPLGIQRVPGFAPYVLHNPQVDWMHKTVPQKHALLGHVDQVSRWPRGKLLGGSSNLNYMVYVRSHPLDYDNWANLTGDPTWSYENVLPYFKKSINYNGRFYTEKHYGGSGPLSVESRKWEPLLKEFVSAGQELGYPYVDLNGPQKSGFCNIERTQKNGARFGTYSAFLQPILNRKNLQISRYSQATKVQLDKNGRAVGVWYIRHGKKHYVRSSKEIIVSAGSIDSPKLLMLSGIGPEKHLKDIKIKPKVNLPVGENLLDHLAVILPNIVSDQPVSFIPERDFGVSSVTDYLLHGSGPLTAPSGFVGHAFISTSAVRSRQIDWPDLQLYLVSAGHYANLPQDFANFFGFKMDVLEKYLENSRGKDGFFLVPTLARPHSVGNIKLKNTDPLTPPVIDPHYLEDPRDVKVLVEGMEFARKLLETKSFGKINATIERKPFPGCESSVLFSTDYWECYVRHVAMTLYHHSGTCRMGKPSDKSTVVDSKLRVLKTIGLRVADNSIQPVLVNGNTNAAAIMIGEKVSDFIREYWSRQYAVCDKLTHFFLLDDDKKCHYSRVP